MSQGGTAAGSMIFSMGMDRSEFSDGLQKTIKDTEKAGVEIGSAWKSLRTKTDAEYNAMSANAIASYTAIKNAGVHSAEEIARAQYVATAQVNNVWKKQFADQNQMWNDLGIRSQKAIKSQIDQVTAAATATQTSVKKGSQEWINIETAKNNKLKELNNEMMGQHEMSMASMTRALLRFYAAWYVASAGVSAIFNFVMGGVKSIDEMKLSTIAIAAQITSMQGTTGNVAENYRKNVEYAKALVPVLMQVDAASFANFEQIQLMNRSATQHGIILDINKQKQIEAFTAITNSIALLATGQNKTIQASQEMRALTSGQVKATDAVAMQIDAIIKQEGKYKDGLKDIVKLGKEHGDFYERLAPYLVGMVAASGDISTTWAAVSSSLETAWGIIQRGMFKNIYVDITKSGQQFAVWLKKNQDDIVQKIKDTVAVFEWAIVATVGFFVIFETAAIIKLARAGDAAAWFALRWERMTQAVTLSTSKMLLGFNVFMAAIIGWEIGGLLNKFEIVRKFGVNMVYALIDGWELVKNKAQIAFEYMAANAKSKFNPDNREAIIKESNDKISVLKKQHEVEQKLRDEWHTQQLRDVTDAAIAEAKAREKAVKTVTPEVKGTVVGTKDSVKDRQEELKSKMAADKDYYQELLKTADHAATILRLQGQDEYKTIKDLYYSKKVILNDYLETQYRNAEEQVALEAKAATLTKDGVAKKYNADEVLYQKKLAIWQEYHKDYRNLTEKELIDVMKEGEKRIAVEADVYSKLSPYSENAHQSQLKLWDKEMKEYQTHGVAKERIAELLALKEIKWNEKVFTYYANYYDNLKGYEDEYRKNKLSLIEETRKKEIEAVGEVAAARKAEQKIAELDYEITKKRNDKLIEGFGSLGTAFTEISKLYAEGSEDAKKWEEAAKVMEIAQKAVAVVNAVAAVAAASAAPFPAGFVAGAAMLASMVALLGSIGVGLGGGVSAATTPTLYTSTVLGAEAGTGSESIAKSWELMQDTYDMQYHELRGIYNEMKNLNDNITGLVSSIFRTGGTKGFNVELGTKLNSTMQGSYDFMQILRGINITNKIFGEGSMLAKFFDLPANIGTSIITKALGYLFGGDVTSSMAASGISFGSVSNRSLQSGGSLGSQQYGVVAVHEDGGWFSSDKDWSYKVYQALDNTTSALFDKVFKNMGSVLVELAKGLGTDVNAALDYVFAGTEINLMGMDAAEMSTALNEYFSAMSDNAVQALFGSIISGYQEIGEGMMETASRLIIDKAVVLDILKMTNHAYTGTTSNAIALSESLIALAGDLETLQDYSSTYYDKFFTDTEKQTRLQTQLTDAMSAMNYSLPVTRDGYRAIVEGLNLTTASGQSAYVSLLALSEYADSYYSSLEDTAETAADKISDLVDELKSLSTTISEWLASLGISELNPVLSEQSYKNQYSSLLAAATGAGATSTAITDYLNYATTFLTYEKSYGSSGSYQAIYDAVVSDVLAIQAANSIALASYASGTSYVPETGLYQLHQGEIVSNKSDSVSKLGQQIAKYIIESNGGSNGGDINVSVQIDGKEIGNVVAKQTRTNSDLQKSIRSLN